MASAALPMGLDHHQGHHHQQQQAGGGLQLGLRDTTSLHLHQQQQQQGRQDMTGGTRRPENQGTKKREDQTNQRTKGTRAPKDQNIHSTKWSVIYPRISPEQQVLFHFSRGEGTMIPIELGKGIYCFRRNPACLTRGFPYICYRYRKLIFGPFWIFHEIRGPLNKLPCWASIPLSHSLATASVAVLLWKMQDTKGDI